MEFLMLWTKVEQVLFSAPEKKEANKGKLLKWRKYL
jgi:hypothetical protein